MALALLFLFLFLLETVQSQDQDFYQTAEAESLLQTFFVQPNFNYSWRMARKEQQGQYGGVDCGNHACTFSVISLLQVLGKWYALAMADVAIKNGAKKKINMHSVFFNVTDDHGYLFTTIMYRLFLPNVFSKPIMVDGSYQECDRWIRKFSPTQYPRIFILKYPSRSHGLQSYTMTVLSTNSNEYALMVFGKEFHDKEYIHLMLYGRTKKQRLLMKESFIYIAQNLGFTEDNMVFFIPIEKCIDES
ncbi:neutrophil gelatinase-associated lipocalin-like [Octodon degus]|uniref:Neutrophil gelatinase-associated lipocalin-like n=1 Tax=Octodon degus TaxID=10160 RepID=A0A6P3VDC7_OCTDE|nr:neutrophil gelatinase-associated lipocalin-like [Octodon degus]